MSSEIHLISDGDGLAVIGSPLDVERFLRDHSLDHAPSAALDMRRLAPLASAGGTVGEFSSQIAESSGRWVKLTAESAEAVRRHGLMASKTPGVSHAMIGTPGNITQWIQIEKAGAVLTNPIVLGGVSGMMQQLAIQEQMQQMLEYLQDIDEKVSDILRNQKDSVFADMIGVDQVIKDALTVREEVGRVSDVTWSKLQTASMTIASTQIYAIRQLEAIADKLQSKSGSGEMAKATRDAESEVREWLAVLAFCMQLKDGVDVLELDRVLDDSPEELDDHRRGLATARRNRLELIASCTSRLLQQMDEAVQAANSKVLLNPIKSPATVRSSNRVATELRALRQRLGIECDHMTAEARRWLDAAIDVRDKWVTAATDGARVGADTIGQAAEVFRPVDVDGDGIPDRSRARSAAENAGAAIRDKAADTIDAVGAGVGGAGTAIGELASGAVGAVSSKFRRKGDPSDTSAGTDAEIAGDDIS